jgi:hypothetical protein
VWRKIVTKLSDLAAVLRSKNAGPFLITIDVLFDRDSHYQRVMASNAMTPVALAPRLRLSASDVDVIPYPLARAIKVTIPRLHSAGSPLDTDVYGAQQHAPLLDIDIPDEE